MSDWDGQGDSKAIAIQRCMKELEESQFRYKGYKQAGIEIKELAEQTKQMKDALNAKL